MEKAVLKNGQNVPQNSHLDDVETRPSRHEISDLVAGTHNGHEGHRDEDTSVVDSVSDAANTPRGITAQRSEPTQVDLPNDVSDAPLSTSANQGMLTHLTDVAIDKNSRANWMH